MYLTNRKILMYYKKASQIFSGDIFYGNYWAFILLFPFKKAMVCLLIDSMVTAGNNLNKSVSNICSLLHNKFDNKRSGGFRNGRKRI
jgi:hypothetical protein